ncbi:MAG: alpha/beta fold hydrolase [Actinomycetota bacterium]
MFKYLFCLSIILATFLIISAQQPPLVDRELFFGNPEIAASQLSPDGRFISFIKPLNGVRNIFVKGTDEPFAAAKAVTNETKRPIPSYFWSQDGKYILFVKDNDGDENFNVYAVNPAEATAAKIPAARNLTEGKNVRAFIQAVPKSEPDAIYVGLNDRDAAWHDLYKVSIATGQKTLIHKNTERLQGFVFDNTDKIRLATRSAENGDTEVLRVEDNGSFTKIYDCNWREICTPVRFHKDNKRVYMETNKGDRDLTQLVLFDPVTLKEELVEQDPMNRVDFGATLFSDITNELILTSYEDDKPCVYFKDKSFEKDYNDIKKKLGGAREINFQSNTKDEQKWLVVSYSDTDPGTVWLYDRKTKGLSTLYVVREKIPREAMSEMKAIRYKSSDGLEIPAFLTLPKGLEAKNLPLVVLPHGGPWSRDSWGFNNYSQLLANRGYAVLQPNFRASTGYGKKFLNSGNKQWGDLMQDDITYGVKNLVSQGIVDAKRVGIMGGSYGGYATLAGVTFTPDVYAAAVAIVAPSNLNTLLASIPPYWEAGRKTFNERMGDPATPEGKAQLDRQSPLNSVDKIKTPLMIVQGANDPRVKKTEADQIVVALRERGFPVEYLLAPDEGHGFQRPVNNLAMIMSVEKFLAKHLGGRFQDGGTTEVTQRLKEITVDVKTVTLAKKVDTNAKAAVDVSGKWTMIAEAPGQTVQIALDLKQTDDKFNGTMSSMLGAGSVENGKVSGNNVQGTAKVIVNNQSVDLKIDGTVEGDTMKGTLDSAFGLIPFTATKDK